MMCCDMCLLLQKLSWYAVRFTACWLKHGTTMNYFLMMHMKRQRTMKNQMCQSFHQRMMLMMLMLKNVMMLGPIAMKLLQWPPRPGALASDG